jgi:hypothetical protein
MENLVKEILKKRPSLAESSIKTYKSVLSNIYKKVYPNDKEIDIEKFNNVDDFIKQLNDVAFNKRKTILAGLVVISGKKEYNKLMMEDITKHKMEEMKQTKNEKQEENWLDYKDVERIVNENESVAKALYNKPIHSITELQHIQNYILLCLTTGIYVEPRRSIDWIMKWKNYDVSKDNYVDFKKNKFIFQNYKTAKTYHKVEIDIPRKLKAILQKWFKINPTDYVLFDRKFQSIMNVKITERLNNIFGKRISTSMLRHIYITHKFGDVNLKEIQDSATAMGNSPLQLLQYVKH